MYTKTITPHFTRRPMGKNGTRQKLNGYIGELRDGEMLIHSKEYSTHHDAEVALDALAFELLHDLAEQGLIDELPAFEPSTCVFCHKPHAPADCPEKNALLFAPDDEEPIITPFIPCPDCSMAHCECDIGSDEWNRMHAPLDLDFAPVAWSE